MYQVSSAYITAMGQKVHQFQLAGIVGGVSFSDADILAGSLSITNQFSNGNDFAIGSVYIGTLSCTFRKGINVPDYNTDIVLSEGLKLADGTYEYVPLGIYRVTEATKSAVGTVVKASDRMAFFDQSAEVDQTFGTPYDLVSMACVRCNVTLGMTRSEMEALPNGTVELNFYPENDIQTWRDLIYWVAQTQACFATIDRQGRLVFRSFKSTPVDTIDSYHRFQGATFSNFVTRYSGISIVNLEDKNTNYYGGKDDQYLVYNLGSNPLLQYGSPVAKEQRRVAVLNGLANVQYVPFKATSRVGALYDLGDVLTQSEGLGNGAKVCIMRYVWKYGRSYEMEGVGKNPALVNARSKIDKSIQGIMNSIGEDQMQYYLFTNTEAISISDGQTKRIIALNFASNKKTVVMLNAEVLLTAETTANSGVYEDLVGTVRYRHNEVYIDAYKPEETWVDGKHILNLFYPLVLEDANMNDFEVYLKADGGNITIGQGQIKCSLSGQNLAASDTWNNRIDFEDEYDMSALSTRSSIGFVSITGGVDVDVEELVGDTITQNIAPIAITVRTAITDVSITDTVGAEFEPAE